MPGLFEKLPTLFLISSSLTTTSLFAETYEVDFTSFGNSKFGNPWRSTKVGGGLAPFTASAFYDIPVLQSLLPNATKTAGQVWTVNNGAGVDGGGGGNAIAAKVNNNGPQEIDIAFDAPVDLTNTILNMGLSIQNNHIGFNNRNPILFVSDDGGTSFDIIFQNQLFEAFTSTSRSTGVLSFNTLRSLGYISSDTPDFFIIRSIDTVLNSGGDFWVRSISSAAVPEPETYLIIISFVGLILVLKRKQLLQLK